jgi:hypothetical protein
MLIAGHGHLARVLSHYAIHYNQQRPHRGIDLGVPAGTAEVSVPTFEVRRHDVLGGLIHVYYPAAA